MNSLIVSGAQPNDQGTRSPIELLWTAKNSFPIFGNRNEEIMPNFWQREYEAGIPGNGQEQDVNISLFAIFL